MIKKEVSTVTGWTKTFEFSSTVLEGETVGSWEYDDVPATEDKKKFISYANGVKMSYLSWATYWNFEWLSPEGTTMYGNHGATATEEFDARGGALGTDNPYQGGGGYGGGAGHGDAQHYARCEWEGFSIPCGMKERLDRLQGIQDERLSYYQTKSWEKKEKRKKEKNPETKGKLDTVTASLGRRVRKPGVDLQKGESIDPGSVPVSSGANDDGCVYGTDGDPNVCTVQALPWTETDVDASEGSMSPPSNLPLQNQIPECLRNFLRPFFPNVQLGNIKSISPVDDARFISTPGLGRVTSAITLGLYNIHYDPTQVDITGGQDMSSIGVIAEELAHAVQFIGVWEIVEGNTGTSGSYNRARDSWTGTYLGASGRVVATNLAKATSFWITGVPQRLGDLYADNKYEKEAKEKARVVTEAAKQLLKSPCHP